MTMMTKEQTMATRKNQKTAKMADTLWKYQGHEYELDMNDLPTIERYDRAVEAMKGFFQELPAGASDARRLIAYCEGIARMLDVLFGDGTAEALLGGSQKPTDYDDVFDSLTDFVHEQTAAAAERRQKILDKYRPQQNRETRRALEQIADRLGKSTS